MNKGLELFLKGSNVEDTKKAPPPQNIGEAIDGVIKYIESQLPKVIDVDFTPISFDLTEDEKRLIMGGQHGNIGIFDLPGKKITKDIELCSCPITSVVFALRDTIVIVVNEMNVIYILDFPSFNLICNFMLLPNKLVIKPGYQRNCIYISNYTSTVLVYDLLPLESVDNRSDIIKREVQTDGVATCLDICEDGSLIAFGFQEGIVRLYHGETESQLQSSEIIDAAADIISFGQGRKLLAAGFSNAKIMVWNIDPELSVKSVIECHTSY